MAQQINLFNPILLTPKRYFSAAAMAQALGVFALALAALCGWSLWRTQALRADLATSGPMQAAERQRLGAALAAVPGAGSDLPALEQELAAAAQGLEQRQRLQQELGGGSGARHSPVALLRRLAMTLPAPVWLTDVKLSGKRLELAGLTLQPEALEPWLADWTLHPIAEGRPAALVRVERQPAGAPGGGEAWAFQIVQGNPATGAQP